MTIDENFKFAFGEKASLSESKVCQSFEIPMSPTEKILGYVHIGFGLFNITAAVIELILVLIGELSPFMLLVPILHLALLWLPYFYFTNLPPILLELYKKELVLTRKTIFNQQDEIRLTLEEISHLKETSVYFKGTYSSQINAILKTGEKIVLIRKAVPKPEYHKYAVNFISQWLNKNVEA